MTEPTTPVPGIFVNYRRQDTSHVAGQLYDRLEDAAVLIADDPQLAFYLRRLAFGQIELTTEKSMPTIRNRVFISYTHADSYWLQRLRVHLTPLVRDGGIEVWDDTMIAVGARWRDEIKIALESARWRYC